MKTKLRSVRKGSKKSAVSQPRKPNRPQGPQVVLSYPVPTAAPAKPSPYQRKRRGRRKNRGWIKFHVAELEVEQLRALARCYGVTFDWFVRVGLYHMRIEIERQLGIDGRRALELMPVQRVQLADLLWSVRVAVNRQGYISGDLN